MGQLATFFARPAFSCTLCAEQIESEMLAGVVVSSLAHTPNRMMSTYAGTSRAQSIISIFLLFRLHGLGETFSVYGSFVYLDANVHGWSIPGLPTTSQRCTLAPTLEKATLRQLAYLEC